MRAYAKAAAMALDANQIKESAVAAFCQVRFSYELSDAFRKLAEREVLDVAYEYAESVIARFPIRKERVEDLFLKITDTLLGKATCLVEREDYYRF